jgi:hypothetical protein
MSEIGDLAAEQIQNVDIRRDRISVTLSKYMRSTAASTIRY